MLKSLGVAGAGGSSGGLTASTLSVLIDKADEKGSEAERIARASFVACARLISNNRALLAYMGEMAEASRHDK